MIVILTQSFPSRIGGTETLVSNFALSLGKEHKVIVFADRHHLFYDTIYDNQHKDHMLVRRIGGIKFFRRRKKINELKLFIESNQVKLVIADTWKSLELGINYLNVKNIPTLCLAHGNDLLYDSSKKFERITSTLNKVNSIVANSQYTIGLINNLKLKNKNVKFVHPGANDLRKIKADSFMQINGTPVIVTLARLEKRKGHIQIIETVKKLKLKFSTIQYIIAGEGPEKSNLKKIVEKYDLSSNVYFAGLVNESQKKYLFENADLMVMPTLDESEKRSIEGFGIVYLEAAFFGIPSIASNIGGTPEAVLHNKTGIIIEDFDNLYQSIYKLLSNKKLKKQLGENAQERAINKFKWNFVTKNYLKQINFT